MNATIELKGFTFRIKKMNAIEALALRAASSLNTVDESIKFFNDILERLEVQLKESWLPVKEKGRSVYYPAGIEEDMTMIQELVNFFMKEFVTPFFESSDESKD